jgi:hypothetical protein
MWCEKTGPREREQRKAKLKLHCLDGLELTYYEDAQQRQCHILTRLSLAVSQNLAMANKRVGILRQLHKFAADEEGEQDRERLF